MLCLYSLYVCFEEPFLLAFTIEERTEKNWWEKTLKEIPGNSGYLGLRKYSVGDEYAGNVTERKFSNPRELIHEFRNVWTIWEKQEEK